MVNLHIKQRHLAALRYRPEPWGAYAMTGTYVVPRHAPEYRALQGAPDRPDPHIVVPPEINPAEPNIFDPITFQPQRRRLQAKAAWLALGIGVGGWLIFAIVTFLRAWKHQ